MENYLDQLNPSQRAAVEYCDGPQLVIAGAGSGKTRVLTMKVAYLLTHGYRPDEVLALTFTKKAATEMQQRIQTLVGPGAARRVWMGTFHSIFSRILRREAPLLGFKPDFTIYDQTDSRSLVKTIIKEMQLDDKTYKPNAVQGQISNAKNNLVTPGMYMANAELRSYDRQCRRPLIGEIYQEYWNRCYKAGAMDFDDLLLYTNILFRDHPEVLERYQLNFKYLLVDEYQDTNRAQHLIVEKLVQQHHHLCVVGDDAQSIYSFRGANIHNILGLQQQIQGTRLFKLEQNYRSTQTIVDAANSLISHNREQIQKKIYSENEQGNKLRLTATTSDLEEAFKVAQQVESLHLDGEEYTTMAILYRTNAQSRQLEEALRKRNIDYRIYGGLSFYQRKEIKDVISYLKLICNPADEEAFKRVINTPARGIGQTTIDKLVSRMREGAGTLFDICADPIGCGLNVNKGTAQRLIAFAQMIQHLQELNRTQSAYEVALAAVLHSGIRKELAEDSTVEGQSRRENVEELLSAIQTFVIENVEAGQEVHLIDFLADVSLSGDFEPTSAEDKADAQRDCVTMMTIHSAKGLEFRNVWIVGIEENLLPSEMALNEPGGVEEERRLFYVALTRAERNCYLSYATSRFRNGKSEFCRPSRFIKDIDRQYIEQTGSLSSSLDYGSIGGGSFDSSSSRSHSFANEGSSSQSRSFALPSPPTMPDMSRMRRIPHVAAPATSSLPNTSTSSHPNTSTSSLPYPLGTRIQHNRFGKGTVIDASGQGEDARITVHFDVLGNKTLLLKFAKIEVIDQ